MHESGGSNGPALGAALVVHRRRHLSSLLRRVRRVHRLSKRRSSLEGFLVGCFLGPIGIVWEMSTTARRCRWRRRKRTAEETKRNLRRAIRYIISRGRRKPVSDDDDRRPNGGAVKEWTKSNRFVHFGELFGVEPFVSHDEQAIGLKRQLVLALIQRLVLSRPAVEESW